MRKLQELLASKAISKTLSTFVLDPNFLEIKDYFLSNIPKGPNALGQMEGTAFVFNKLEEFVKDPKPKEKPKPKRETGSPDPDLSEE